MNQPDLPPPPRLTSIPPKAERFAQRPRRRQGHVGWVLLQIVISWGLWIAGLFGWGFVIAITGREDLFRSQDASDDAWSGFAFLAFGLFAAQLFRTSRAANSLSVTFVLAAYLLRGIGDAAGTPSEDLLHITPA